MQNAMHDARRRMNTPNSCVMRDRSLNDSVSPAGTASDILWGDGISVSYGSASWAATRIDGMDLAFRLSEVRRTPGTCPGDGPNAFRTTRVRSSGASVRARQSHTLECRFMPNARMLRTLIACGVIVTGRCRVF